MKTKEVILNVNVPEPGDTLPFVVLGHDTDWLMRYDNAGDLRDGNGYPVAAELAKALGLETNIDWEKRTVVA